LVLGKVKPKAVKKKKELVQIKNPKTGKYVKIDKTKGLIISHKKTVGPFPGIPIVSKKKK